MNRVRLAMLAGVFAVGLGLGGSSAQAQYIGGPGPAPGYYSYAPGGGYYYAPPPAPSFYAPRYYAPAPTYRAPARSMNQGRGYPDITGRHDRLARPWLRPLR